MLLGPKDHDFLLDAFGQGAHLSYPWILPMDANRDIRAERTVTVFVPFHFFAVPACQIGWV